MKNNENTIQILKNNGFRITRAREALIDIFQRKPRPLSAGKIGEMLASLGISANKTTIYRELTFLVNAGLLKEIHFQDRKKRYELAGRAHHHHLVCNSCGSLEDIALPRDLESAESRIEKQTGYKIASHMLEFFGVCKQCQ